MFFLTACEREPLALVEKDTHSIEAFLLEINDGKNQLTGGTCNCSYEIIEITISDPPTSDPNDHFEFRFGSPKLCDPNGTDNCTYFGAEETPCWPVPTHPCVDEFPLGTSTPGFIPFQCEIPRFDLFEVDMDLAVWILNCALADQSSFNGEIKFRVKCLGADPPLDGSEDCKPAAEFLSNTMASTFTGGGFPGLNNETSVFLGVIETVDGNGSTVWSEGCGCEPLIYEL